MRCPRHDLAMAPDGKCVRCRREEEEAGPTTTATPASNAPRVAAVVILGIAAAGGLTVALRPHRPLPSIPTPALSAPSVASAPPLAPLDPALVPADLAAAAPAPSGPTSLDRAMHDAKIDLYCRADSPECAQARAWLLARGYVYKERNVDADRAAARAFTRVSPDGTVPAFDIDGQTFAGFDPARIQGALEYAGAQRLQR